MSKKGNGFKQNDGSLSCDGLQRPLKQCFRPVVLDYRLPVRRRHILFLLILLNIVFGEYLLEPSKYKYNQIFKNHVISASTFCCSVCLHYRKSQNLGRILQNTTANKQRMFFCKKVFGIRKNFLCLYSLFFFFFFSKCER